MLGCPGQHSILLCTLRNGYQGQQPAESYMSVACITNPCVALHGYSGSCVGLT